MLSQNNPAVCRIITSHKVEGKDHSNLEDIYVLPPPPDLLAHNEPSRHYEIALRGGLSPQRILIPFQQGHVREVGINGCSSSALVAILIDHLESLNVGDHKNADTDEAIAHLRAAQESIQRRSKARIARGVEGTSQT